MCPHETLKREGHADLHMCDVWRGSYRLGIHVEGPTEPDRTDVCEFRGSKGAAASVIIEMLRKWYPLAERL